MCQLMFVSHTLLQPAPPGAVRPLFLCRRLACLAFCELRFPVWTKAVPGGVFSGVSSSELGRTSGTQLTGEGKTIWTYTHLNAEFPRTARREEKAFLSDQCKEIEENNKMGKTRDLFKKIRDTKGTFHAKMGSIKNRSGMDLREAEDIKKGWQEYIEELYKKRS